MNKILYRVRHTRIEPKYRLITGSLFMASFTSVYPLKRTFIVPCVEADVESAVSILLSSRITRARLRLLEKVRLPPVTPASGVPPRLM
jgi:hypothetical protein